MQLDISGFYPDLFLQKSGGGVFTVPCFLYAFECIGYPLYGVYYGAYKIANFCFFGFSPHKLLYKEKTTYQNFRIF